MCVKLPLGPCSSYPKSIYTCEVTTALRVCSGNDYNLRNTTLVLIYSNNKKTKLKT